MKLNIRTEALFEQPEYDDGGNDIGSQELVYALPSTRFNISNEDELTQALEDSIKQILLQKWHRCVVSFLVATLQSCLPYWLCRAHGC